MAIQIELSEGRGGTVSTGAELAQWLDALAQGSSVSAVLSRGPEDYVQAALERGGYRVEKRAGDESCHYEAMRIRPPVAASSVGPTRFGVDDVQLIFEDYLAGRDSAAFVRWRRIALSQPLLGAGQRIIRGLAILILFSLIAVAGIWAMGGFG
ncbi:hypothetical protein [Sphingomonas sp. MS122]|uniref:hypothetical protein n=1 Tax=Sphingomonas sp. MS122 TaxID=3412683 RepID=UPI003C30DF01